MVRLLLCSILVLPSLGAAVVSVLPSEGGSETVENPRPALVFDQYYINFHRVKPSRYVTARYRYTNRSDRPVTITALDPSCGCLNPVLTKDKLQPGETGEFFLRVDMALQKSGPQEYTATMRYTDPEPRQQTVVLRMELPEERVTIEPRALMVYASGSGTTTYTVTVKDFREKPLTIRAVRSELASITASVEQTETDEIGIHNIPITVSVTGPLPKRETETVLRIETDDPEYTDLKVPVRLRRLDTSALLPPPSAVTKPRQP